MTKKLQEYPKGTLVRVLDNGTSWRDRRLEEHGDLWLVVYHNTKDGMLGLKSLVTGTQIGFSDRYMEVADG